MFESVEVAAYIEKKDREVLFMLVNVDLFFSQFTNFWMLLQTDL